MAFCVYVACGLDQQAIASRNLTFFYPKNKIISKHQMYLNKFVYLDYLKIKKNSNQVMLLLVFRI